MPYLHRVTRVTISGTAFNGAEEWSTGFNVGEVDGDATMPSQAQADAYMAAWRTFFIHTDSGISTSYETTLLKVSSLGTDGKSNAADTMFATPSAVTKGQYPRQNPPQVALVATLVGLPARGVASKGRMYLPGIGIDLDGTGHIPAIQRDPILTNFKAFLQAVNAFEGTPNFVMLASPGSLNKDGTPRIGGSGPKNSIVQSVRLGNVYDTQRRRRNGLVEQYKSEVL